MDMLNDQETVGELSILSWLEICRPCVPLRARFVNVGMMFLSVLGVMECVGVGIDERTESGGVHGNPAKGEEDRGATGGREASVVKSKEAGHSGK